LEADFGAVLVFFAVLFLDVIKRLKK
jgi:hypothetical protein